MFLSVGARLRLISDLNDMTADDAIGIFEFYKAKGSRSYSARRLSTQLGWSTIDLSDDRFIACKKNQEMNLFEDLFRLTHDQRMVE